MCVSIMKTAYWFLTHQLATCSHLKDLKASDVEDSQEGGSLTFGLVQCLVDSGQDPAEQTLKHSFSQGFGGKVSLTNTHGEHI